MLISRAQELGLHVADNVSGVVHLSDGSVVGEAEDVVIMPSIDGSRPGRRRAATARAVTRCGAIRCAPSPRQRWPSRRPIRPPARSAARPRLCSSGARPCSARRWASPTPSRPCAACSARRLNGLACGARAGDVLPAWRGHRPRHAPSPRLAERSRADSSAEAATSWAGCWWPAGAVRPSPSAASSSTSMRQPWAMPTPPLAWAPAWTPATAVRPTAGRRALFLRARALAPTSRPMACASSSVS